MKRSIKMQVIVLFIIVCPVAAGIILAGGSLNRMLGISSLSTTKNARANFKDSVTTHKHAPEKRKFYEDDYLIRLYHRYR